MTLKLLGISGVSHQPFLFLQLPPLLAQLLRLIFKLLDQLASLSLVPFPLFLVTHAHLLQVVYYLYQRFFPQELFEPIYTLTVCLLAKNDTVQVFEVEDEALVII